MPVASLQSMALAVCKKHICHVDDLGDMPYKTAEPILRYITNPEQLMEIQAKSPHLAEHTEDLWIALIKRDVPSWERNRIAPKNKALWWKVYRKVKKEDDDLKEQQHQELKNAMMQHATKNFNEGFAILPDLLIPDDAFRRGPTKKPVAARRANGGVSKYAGPGATSAAMQNFRKETAKLRVNYGAAHTTRGTLASKEMAQSQRFLGRPNKSTRGKESHAIQGARKLDEYLRHNQAELKSRNERLKQIRASRFNHRQSTPTASPPKVQSPVRPPRSSSNSAASSSAGSAASTPARRVVKRSQVGQPVTKTPLDARHLPRTSLIAAPSSPSRKLSFEAFTMRRMGSASEGPASKRAKIDEPFDPLTSDR